MKIFKPLPLSLLNSILFVVFGTYAKIGSSRLPTHSRNAHKKFFMIPSF